MDDMKKSIYMSALEKIEKGRTVWVCIALECAVREIMGMNFVALTDEDLMEFFPEFFTLHDGKTWNRNGYEEMGSDPSQIVGKTWWQYAWKTPRVRILNCILCQH